jgi:hypothetical protein
MEQTIRKCSGIIVLEPEVGPHLVSKLGTGQTSRHKPGIPGPANAALFHYIPLGFDGKLTRLNDSKVVCYQVCTKYILSIPPFAHPSRSPSMLYTDTRTYVRLCTTDMLLLSSGLVSGVRPNTQHGRMRRGPAMQVTPTGRW